MKVTLVTNSLSGGGAERSMNLLGNLLLRMNYEVNIIAINRSNEDYVKNDCQVYSLNRIWLSGLWNTIFSAIKFNLLIKKLHPDILILNCDLPELFGCLTLRKIKLLVIEHSYMPWAKRKQLGKLVRFFLNLRGAKWASVSKELHIWPLDSKPEYFLPNLVTNFSQNKALAFGNHLRRLVFIGRLSNEKSPFKFIDISQHTNIPAVIIGDGPLRNEIELSVSEKKLSIELLGNVMNPWELLLPGDLLVIPSASEGDGLVLLEALSLSVPILISRISSFSELKLPHENYCLELAEFCESIEKYRNKLSDLVVEKDLTEEIISSRSEKLVLNLWQQCLSNICT